MAPQKERHRPSQAVKEPSPPAPSQSATAEPDNQERIASPASTVDSWTTAESIYAHSWKSAGTQYATSSRSGSVVSMNLTSRDALEGEMIESGASQYDATSINIPISRLTNNNNMLSTSAQGTMTTTGNTLQKAASNSSIRSTSAMGQPTQTRLTVPYVARPRAPKLPSVLDPATEVIREIPYSDALGYLTRYNDFYASGSGASSVTVLAGPGTLGAKYEDRKVDVTMFDCKGGVLRPTGEMILRATPIMTLPEVVLQLQRHLDSLVTKIEGNQEGDQLLVANIEIKIFANQNFAGFPKIKGELGVRKGEWKGEEECYAEFVSWELGGEMREYWEAFLRCLTTSFQDRGKEVSPMIKVRTVRKVGDASLGFVLLGGGHLFLGGDAAEKDVASYGPSNGKDKEREIFTHEKIQYRLPYDGREQVLRDRAEDIKRENEKAGVKMTDTQAIYTVQVMAGVSQHTFFNDKDELIEEAQEVTNDRAYKILEEMYRRGFPPIHDLVEVPASAYKVPQKMDLDRSWGYYQKKGGDSRMHEAYPIGVGAHGAQIVPFIVDENIWAKSGDASLPVASSHTSTFNTQPPGKESRFMNLIPEMPFHPGMIPAGVQREIEAKKERFKYVKQHHEAASGFESDDDDQFLQPVGGRPPPKDESFYHTNPLGRALNQYDKEQERRQVSQELQGQMMQQFASTTASQGIQHRQIPINHQVRAATPQGGFFGNQGYGHGHYQTQAHSQSPVVFGPALPPGFIRGHHGGRGSVFGHMPHPVRNQTTSQAVFQQNVGLGNRSSELRADSPAFRTTTGQGNHVTGADYSQITPESSFLG